MADLLSKDYLFFILIYSIFIVWYWNLNYSKEWLLFQYLNVFDKWCLLFFIFFFNM